VASIRFPDCTPTYCLAGPGLRCAAQVGGQPASYDVTAEALTDHFGARSGRFEDLLLAYRAHRPAIEHMARVWFRMTGARHIQLHGGHFRVSRLTGTWLPAAHTTPTPGTQFPGEACNDPDHPR
jgi:hypothetical protein